MSANEKELRESRKAERNERRTAAAAEQEKKSRRYRRNVVIVVVVLIVLIVGALLINSNFFYTKTTAMTVGTTKYTPAEVSYFNRSTYNGIYSNIVSQLGNYASMLLDTSKPLSEQAYPYDETGEKTWADAIAESAENDIIRITAFADAATAAGRTLSEEDEATVAQAVETYKEYAASNGFTDVNKFLAAYFGKGVDENTVTKLQRRILLANNYMTEIHDGFTYTGDELAAYYSEHADELDYYDYYAYTLYGSMPQFDDVAEDQKEAKVHEAAETIIAAATDAESYIAAVKEFAGEDTSVNVMASHADAISINYSEWITDPARQPGDTTVLDVNGNSYALFFIGRDNNDYNTVDYRHILVRAEADENGAYTEEALFAARTKAEDIFAQWRQDPTEEHFISLVGDASDDAGSNTNGGLYEQVTKYRMVPGVNAFLFDEGHVAGDAGVVLGKSDTYTGYHVMYYVGDNARNCDLLAENEMREADYNAKTEEITAGYSVVKGSGMRFVSEL